MKNNIKKLLSLVVVLGLVLCGCTCGKEDPKKNANVSDPDSVYISITENSVKYEVTKGKVYSELKSTVGYNTLVDMMVKDLLTKNGLYDAVKDADVVEAIDEAIYDGADKAELEEEQQQEMIDKFLNNMFKNYGYNGDDVYSDQVKAVYRLNLAKEAYAAGKLEEEITEHNAKYDEWVTGGKNEEDENAVKEPYFTEAELESQYTTDNQSEYWAIIVPFTTYREYAIALQQLGVTVNNGKWQKNGADLTDEQVAATFVELYKQVYGYKLTDESNLTLTDLTEESEFYYSNSDLRSYSAVLANHISENYGSYNDANREKGFYSVEAENVNSGKFYALVLKLNEKVAKEYSELTAEEKIAADAEGKESIKESLLTSGYINRMIYSLLADNNLVIYDTALSASHATTVVSYGVAYEATEEESETNVAKTDNKTYTADDLFVEMDRIAGIATALSELTYERFLNNKDINKFYDIKNGTWLDDEAKDSIETQIKTEKQNFEDGNYVQYGYDPETMSWEEFMDAVYSAENEDELMLLFLYGDIVSDFTANLLDVNNKKDGDYVDSKVWEFIDAKMKEEQGKFFNVEGIHLLICIYDEPTGEYNNGTTINPEEWTEEQKALATELYNAVKDYVANNKGTYQNKLEKIQEAFDNCPRTVGDATFNEKPVQTTLNNEDGTVAINVAKYRAAGLYAKYEDLGAFTNGSMVEAFNDAVKAIWDKDIEDDKTDRKTVASEVIVTEYGYHYYVNLGSTKASTYSVKIDTETVKFTTPRLEEIREYLEDTDNVNSDATSIITKYYTPIATEITGNYLTYVLQYEGLLSVIESVDVKSSKYAKDDLVRYMNIELDTWYTDNLKYVTKEDLSYFK